MISFDNVPQSYRASKVFIELFGVKKSLASLFQPATGLIVGMYDPAKTSTVDYVPIKVESADDVGLKAGFGSHAHRQALQFPPAVYSQGGGIYWVPVPEAAGTAANEDITFATTATSSGTFPFLIGGERVEVPVISGDLVATVAQALEDAVTAVSRIAVTANASAAVTKLTAKFKGTQGNQILVVLNPNGESDEALNPTGMTVTLGSVDGFLASGATDPSVEDVFFNSTGEDILGDNWYNIITCPFDDATNLGHYKISGNLRFDPSVIRFQNSPLGFTKLTYAQALAKPATINSRWITPIWDDRCYAPAFELSARLGGIILDEFNKAPNRPYKTIATDLPYNITVNNLLDTKYDALFRAGMSYCKVVAGSLQLGDIALSYRTNPSGGATDEWYDAQSLHLRQAKAYSIEQLYKAAEYARSVVGTDADVAQGISFFVAPKDIKAALSQLIQELWKVYGWSKNIETVLESISAEINSGNESRIDNEITDDPAKVLRIIATKLKYLY